MCWLSWLVIWTTRLLRRNWKWVNRTWDFKRLLEMCWKLRQGKACERWDLPSRDLQRSSSCFVAPVRFVSHSKSAAQPSAIVTGMEVQPSDKRQLKWQPGRSTRRTSLWFESLKLKVASFIQSTIDAWEFFDCLRWLVGPKLWRWKLLQWAIYTKRSGRTSFQQGQMASSLKCPAERGK